ncbi:MAG: SpoIIE family protein phosphatase [Phycisphaerae bacterium]|nr:SpoIIE family protein phosphatase [Phycisphaerae bacterium]
MKLRTRLILSYLIVVVVLAVGLLGLLEIVGNRVARDDLAAADRGVDDVAQANLRLSENVLTSYGEKFVELQGKLVASQLAAKFQGRDLKNYDAMRNDAVLRAAATPNMETYDGIRAGYCDVLDEKGVSVLHPNPDVEGKNFRDWKDDHPKMWELVEEAITAKDERVVKGYYTFLDCNNCSRRKYMAIVPIRGTRFFVCAVVNIDDYFLPVHEKIKDASDAASQRSREDILASTDASTNSMRWIVLIGTIVLVLITGLFGWRLAYTISTPILELRDGVRKIGEGDFSFAVREKGIPEIVELKKSVNQLGVQLTQYMRNLTREVQARQAVESELSVASQIQQSLLPHSFPPFPEHDEFSLHAITRAAKQVGGDFYDFFFIDPKRLVILVGDVSGKGVPASLFMAVTRTVMRIVCAHKDDPAEALASANRLLCRDKDTDLFVTLFLAYYHLDSGVLEYGNAGHNPPFLVSPDGKTRMLDETGGLILAIDPTEVYKMDKITVSPAQTLVLYTDGVTEAMSPTREQFGEERFAELLQRLAGESVKDMCDTVATDVMAYQKGNQFDDLTVLAWRREK